MSRSTEPPVATVPASPPRPLTSRNPRPRLLFHCQHALGLGHLARSLALANGLQADFDVTLLNGGRFPDGLDVPEGVEVVNLDPLGHDAEYQLISHDPTVTVEESMARRTATVMATLERLDPAVVVIELYPFGRKKFGFELEPLLDAIRGGSGRRPLVICSLRDILVNQRRDQQRHDNRAAERANHWFDFILMHTDPAFATLEESFHPTIPLQIPVHYTGFVTTEDGPPASHRPPVNRVLVSVGGGMAGGPLLAVAAQAAPELHRRTGLTTTLVAGPFLPENERSALWAQAEAEPTLEILDCVNDLASEIARSTVSVSQCGYNTAMDLLRAGRPALVVPYAEGREDEQTRRAELLARLDVVRPMASADATTSRYVDEVTALSGPSPPAVRLDLGGRRRSAELIRQLHHATVHRGAS